MNAQGAVQQVQPNSEPAMMNTAEIYARFHKLRRAPLAIAAAMVFLGFAAAAIVHSMFALHTRAEGAEEIVARNPPAEVAEIPDNSQAETDDGPMHARGTRPERRCETCAVVQSTRSKPASGGAPSYYETTLRFADGSTRILRDANPVTWRAGERIIYITGAERSAKTVPERQHAALPLAVADGSAATGR